MTRHGRGLTVFGIVIDRMSATFSKQMTSVFVQMLFEVFVLHPNLRWQALPRKVALASIFAFSEYTACGNKLSKRILKILSRFRLCISLRIDPGDFLDPGDIPRTHFFVNSSQHIFIIAY